MDLGVGPPCGHGRGHVQWYLPMCLYLGTARVAIAGDCSPVPWLPRYSYNIRPTEAPNCAVVTRGVLAVVRAPLEPRAWHHHPPACHDMTVYGSALHDHPSRWPYTLILSSLAPPHSW